MDKQVSVQVTSNRVQALHSMISSRTARLPYVTGDALTELLRQIEAAEAEIERITAPQ